MDIVFGVAKRSIAGRMGGRAGNATDGGVGIAVFATMIVKSVIQTMTRKRKKKRKRKKRKKRKKKTLY
jgi:hypothetical protein